MARYSTTDDCWEWCKAKDSRGYGEVWDKEKKKGIKAHRYYYKKFIGDIPNGLYICHKCDNTSCVNPAHLFLGTQEDNLKDARRKGRLSYAKLTEDIASQIRADYKTGQTTQKYLANIHGVSQSEISDIIRGKRW
jgi:hypothetical protein